MVTTPLRGAPGFAATVISTAPIPTDVDPELIGVTYDFDRADASIDAEDEPGTGGSRLIDDFGAHALAFTEPVRTVEGSIGTGDLEGFHQHTDAGGAIDIVSAVKENACAVADGAD